AARAAHEQIDIGEYVGSEASDGTPVVRIYVDYDFVSPSGGAPVLHEPISVQTAEHWVFLGGKPYDAARPFGVKRVGPATGMVHASLTDFLRDMSTQSVARYVIARAATLPPPSPSAPPAIPAESRSILGAGGYRVYQKGQEVGAILVTSAAEHWGV